MGRRENVTIKCTELLRGKNDGEITLAIDTEVPMSSLKPGAQFLLLSQGNDEVGPALPKFGCSMEYQFNYRGWTPYLIIQDHDQSYVEHIGSFADGKREVDPMPSGASGLTLSHIKRLIDRFPYDPHFHY